MKRAMINFGVLLLLVVYLLNSCNFATKNKMDCPRRPLTKEEFIFFDSLKVALKCDSVEVYRVDFNRCDEKGFYNVTFKYFDRNFLSKQDSLKTLSNYIVCALYTKRLSTKVCAVTNEYNVSFQGHEKVRWLTKGMQQVDRPRTEFNYTKKDLESFTGVKYCGTYFGKNFSRSEIKPLTDSLIIDDFTCTECR